MALPPFRTLRLAILAFAALGLLLLGSRCPGGLDRQAREELADAGVNQYLGEFEPVESVPVGDGWTEHRFDPEGGEGPICIAGTPYSVFTRAGSSHELLIFEQGGGACWQDFYNCNVLAGDQAPPFPREGIWDFDDPENPFRDHSVVYMPYCDGSVFSGDNEVVDPSFPFGPVRFHRGLRNQSAGMDVAEATFPRARRITLAGSSAGGVGVAGFAPFLARFAFGNSVELKVFNDAGPVVVNLEAAADVAARAADWQFGQFYPESCTECSATGQATAVIDWRLDHDRTIREAFYETDADLTNRFFVSGPSFLSQEEYRALILAEHGALHESHPKRYKRFIVSGDTSHTALQSARFYTQSAEGFPLRDWTQLFLRFPLFWFDVVEELEPAS